MVPVVTQAPIKEDILKDFTLPEAEKFIAIAADRQHTQTLFAGDFSTINQLHWTFHGDRVYLAAQPEEELEFHLRRNRADSENAFGTKTSLAFVDKYDVTATAGLQGL